MNVTARVVGRGSNPVNQNPPLLLNNLQCARLMGIGLNRFYELRKLDPNFPKPVQLPGSPERGGRQLRFQEDVERYVRELSRAQRTEGESDDNNS